MPEINVQRVADESYLTTVARAMDTSNVRDATSTAGMPSSQYIRLDYSDVLTVANTEHTPISARIDRREAAKDITHYWLEQTIAGAGAVTPVKEALDPTTTGLFTPSRFANTMMKIGRQFVITDEMNVIAQAGGLIAVGPDEWGRQMQMQLTMLLRDQELAILKASVNSAQTATDGRAMRSILGNYDYTEAFGGGTRAKLENGWWGPATANPVTDLVAVTTSTVKDFGDEQLITGATVAGTSRNIEEALNSYFLQLYNLNAGPLPNVAYVPPRMLKLLQDAAKSKVTIFMTQAELARAAELNLGGAVGKYYTDFGMIDFIAHPLLSAASTNSAVPAAESRVLFLYEPGISIIDYVGHGGIHIEPRAKSTPTETRVIYEYMTLEIRYLQSHGYWRNFWV